MPSIPALALLALAVASLPAMAESRSRSDTSGNGVEPGRFVMWADEVDRLFQEPNETREEFLERVMQRMRRFTLQTSHEASGSLCSDDEGRMGITIVTWHAHFSAPDMGGCPIQTPNKGDFIHTHPLPGTYTLTEQDVKNINQSRRFFKVSTSSTLHAWPANIDRFSPDDYLVGPGYLVSDEKVFYQSGRFTARQVMTLPPLP